MGTPRQQRDKIASKNRRDRNRAYMESKMTPCVKCGFYHPAAMDFHHPDPSLKVKGVSEFVRGGYALQRLVEEIDKCICLCSNCHRILHSEGD